MVLQVILCEVTFHVVLNRALLFNYLSVIPCRTLMKTLKADYGCFEVEAFNKSQGRPK